MSRGRRDLLGRLLATAAASAGAGAIVSAKPVRAAGNVAVVGGGFAGAACALELRERMPELQVTLIDPSNHYVSCPLSNEVLAGWRTVASLTVRRTGLARRGVRIVRDQAVAIDTQRRRVRLGAGSDVRYDRLVLAPGIRLLWGRPEGYSEAAAASMPHAWQAGPQTELLAAQLQAMRPGGVVAISVPAGPMRCPPGPFERASLIAGFLVRANPRAKVLIFDANNRFPRQEVFTNAWQTFYPGMIEWIPVVRGGAVLRVDPSRRTLYTSEGAHVADVINIIPPQAPAALCAASGLAAEHGWCPIAAADFASTLAAHVHIIGDACIADPMPKSASAAVAQASCCARAIVADLRGEAVAAAEMDSVCYSRLAVDRALAIRARFETQDGVIKQIAAGEANAAMGGSEQPSAGGPAEASAEEVGRAEQWYRQILAQSFGTRDS